MKNKGFTLVELLAVIIVLGFVAVIATPFIMDYLNSARVTSQRESAHGYIEAVNNAVGMAIIDNTDRIMNGTYNVDTNGNLVNAKDKNDTLKISYKGDKPTGSVVISYEKVTEATLTFGKVTVKFENDDYTIEN